MAGYIFTLDSFDSLNEIIKNGVYSTNINVPKKNNWLTPHEGTFTDYLSMKEGDNVYFFIDRKIYGIGKLKNVVEDCKLLNFPNADIPIVNDYTELKKEMILNKTLFNLKNRFICTFENNPYFFTTGVDMDDVLASNPSAFKMLRVLWKLSFIKIDDIENKALFDFILKTNEYELANPYNIFYTEDLLHKRIKSLYNNSFRVTSKNILDLAADEDYIRHEMAIEAAIVDNISNNSSSSIFGEWDYVSHQVVASPFKPVDYMDKMDVFGYRYIAGFSTISKYLTIEIKKDRATEDVVHQIMKYVDWINQEYSNDYGMIEAFVVAKHFPKEVINLKNKIGRRVYTKGRRPAMTLEWSNLRFIKYRYCQSSKNIIFEEEMIQT
ncbi:hypothetical protein [Lysinibacillus pakistanensis]|uniref:Uncharacterized protein n=1 Tax=Lysinibacillus pakistanensis TaxID=759811 RepID=A0ABX6D7C4_9BACI|nr:hypothetical protein GDS87_06790 [Lysinibacillus pakistanensis]